MTPVMADAIRKSAGARKSPITSARTPSRPPVSQASPVSPATAIARLETRVASAGQASVSRAPQPVSTLSGRSGGGGKRLEDMNFEEYRRARGF